VRWAIADVVLSSIALCSAAAGYAPLFAAAGWWLAFAGALSLAASSLGAIVASSALTLCGKPSRGGGGGGHRVAAAAAHDEESDQLHTDAGGGQQRSRSSSAPGQQHKTSLVAFAAAWTCVCGALVALALVGVGEPTWTCETAECRADPLWCYDPATGVSYNRDFYGADTWHASLFDQYCFETDTDAGGCFYEYGVGHGHPSGRHWCLGQGVQACGDFWGSPFEKSFERRDKRPDREWSGFETRLECEKFYLPKILALKLPLICMACILLFVRVAAAFAARRATLLRVQRRQLTELARVMRRARPRRLQAATATTTPGGPPPQATAAAAAQGLDATEYRLLDEDALAHRPPGAVHGGFC